jgi:FlaA1/EpsC-like NDP-sugar epimerase
LTITHWKVKIPMLAKLAKLSRFEKRILMALTDLCLVNGALWLAFSLRLWQWYVPSPVEGLLFAVASGLCIPVFAALGIYHSITRFISYKGLLIIVKATDHMKVELVCQAIEKARYYRAC